MSFLNNHPFAVEAFFESSLVLTFAVPKLDVAALLPPCLQADTFQDKYAFIAVAMVQTKNLRPKGFPSFMGSDFFLIGYRIFVRHINEQGKRLRGLYILKSETNKKKMALLGNIFTHYSYTTTDIFQEHNEDIYKVTSNQSCFSVTVNEDASKVVALPDSSPFADWKEARRFAGPLPFTFTYLPAEKKVLIIEGVREHWTPQPVRVIDYHFDFLEKPAFENAVLANAFIIKNIPYHWKKGKLESWNG